MITTTHLTTEEKTELGYTTEARELELHNQECALQEQEDAQSFASYDAGKSFKEGYTKLERSPELKAYNKRFKRAYYNKQTPEERARRDAFAKKRKERREARLETRRTDLRLALDFRLGDPEDKNKREDCLELARLLDPTTDLSNLNNKELYRELGIWTEWTQELRDKARERRAQPRQPRRRA